MILYDSLLFTVQGLASRLETAPHWPPSLGLKSFSLPNFHCSARGQTRNPDSPQTRTSLYMGCSQNYRPPFDDITAPNSGVPEWDPNFGYMSQYTPVYPCRTPTQRRPHGYCSLCLAWEFLREISQCNPKR